MLQALYQLAYDEGLMADPDYEPKPVAWIVRVEDGGKLLGIESTRYTPPAEGKKKPKTVAKSFSVPRQSIRTSGVLAFLLCDKSEYVFGMTAPLDKAGRTDADKTKARAKAFSDKVKECLDATEDSGVKAVRDLLAAIAEGKTTVTLAEDCAPNDLFAFAYQNSDELVHQRPAVREFWKKQRQPADGDGAATGQTCLVTGQLITEVGLFPLLKKVPGGTTSGISLVGFNRPAFWSHGWENNDNAPISRDAAEACATAFKRLLDANYPDPKNPGSPLPRWHVRISDDTIVCFWAAGGSGSGFSNVLAALLEANDPGKVGDLYQSLWRGRTIQINDPSAFYAVTLSGTQGRAIIRDWFETSVQEVADNLARHFADLNIVRNTPKPRERDLPPVLPLPVLLRSLAPMGDEKGIPDPLVTQFVHAALRGRPYPRSLLQRALERSRAEVGRTDWADLERRDARAALIKAVLIRNTTKEITVAMNPNSESTGYNLGCLMAVLERLQEAALGQTNASVIDRFYGAASATPRSVFVRLLRNAQHHARKAQDENGGMAFLLKGLVDEFATRFHVDPRHYPTNAVGIPSFLPLEEQGLFVLGYHQMRKWLWMNKEERTAWMQGNADAPRAFRWGEKSATQPAVV